MYWPAIVFFVIAVAIAIHHGREQLVNIGQTSTFMKQLKIKGGEIGNPETDTSFQNIRWFF